MFTDVGVKGTYRSQQHSVEKKGFINRKVQRYQMKF